MRTILPNIFFSIYHFYFQLKMNKKLRCFLLILILIVSSGQFQSFAQGLIGYNVSNYAGTNGNYLNPASIADSRHKFYLNLISTDILMYNDYVHYDNNIGIITAAKDTSFKWNDHLIYDKNGKPHNFDFQNETRGPGFMFSWNDKNSIAFTTRLRPFFQVIYAP